MKRWQRTGSRLLVQDRWLTLRADTCDLPNGRSISPYYVIEERDWVHVVAFDDVGRVLAVRQYRYAADAVCLELPGGVIDDGEDPLTAAQRELAEETGYGAASWQSVGSVFANPARQTNRIHLFIARGLDAGGPQRLDDSEEIEHQPMTIEAIKEAIRLGEFSQSFHIASLYMALAFAHPLSP